MRAVVLILSTSTIVGSAMLVSACGNDSPVADVPGTTQTAPPLDETPPAIAQDSSPWPTALDGAHQDWTVHVVDRLPHDAAAFTQGLEVSELGLFESTGLRGQSTLRRLDLETGTEKARVALDAALFGEGLTVWDDEIIQLTWETGRAFRYDATTLEPTGEHSYDGEGWGICSTATELWMSNGTPELTRRDPTTFVPLETVEVRRDGVLLADLNELECIGDHVVANVWRSNEIVVIDPDTGMVVATIDAASLAADVAPSDPEAVLNGIADLGDGTLLLGGKLWPTFFVVEVVTG